jgi:hypothetical protein
MGLLWGVRAAFRREIVRDDASSVVGYIGSMSRQSPFPGLDPYLQRHWSDFHHSFIQYSRDALQNELPEGLLSRVEERVYLEGFEGRIRSIVPDAHDAAAAGPRCGMGGGVGGCAWGASGPLAPRPG